MTTTQSPLFVNFTDDEIRTAQAVRDASDARMYIAGDHRDSKHVKASRSISKLSYSNVLDSHLIVDESHRKTEPGEVWGNLAGSLQRLSEAVLYTLHGDFTGKSWPQEVKKCQEFGQRCRPFLCCF